MIAPTLPSPLVPRARTWLGRRPLTALRRHLPPGFLLGISVGTPEEAERAAAFPADYWSVGPCFATPTKRDAGPPLGPEGFAALARRAPEGVPVIGVAALRRPMRRASFGPAPRVLPFIGAVLSAPDTGRPLRGRCRCRARLMAAR